MGDNKLGMDFSEMKFIYLESTYTKIPFIYRLLLKFLFFVVLVTIGPSHSLLKVLCTVGTVCLLMGSGIENLFKVHFGIKKV